MKKLLLIATSVLCCTQLWARNLHVSPGQYSSIQSAIDDANDGDTVIVSDGIYQENIDFLGKAITVRSVDPNDPNITAATIIDGSNPVDPNIASVVTFANAEDANSVLTGFTITGGTGSWLLVSWEFNGLRWNRCGGGVVCYNMSAPTISRNVFTGNSAGQGGGIYIYGDPVNPNDPSNPSVHISPVITDNTFTNNTAIVEHGFTPPDENYPNNDHGDGGAIVGFQGCDATITGNLIEDNHADYYGGGIHLRQWSNGLIEDNQIVDNDSSLGAGLHITYTSSPTIRHNLIESNTGDLFGGGGIYVYYLSNPLICNNVIKDNVSGNGAGFSINYTSAPTIMNNLIINNRGLSFGGGIKCTGSNPIIRFNTIFGNSATSKGAGISCLYRSSPTIEHNLVVSCKKEAGIYVMDTPQYPASPVIRYNNVYNNEEGNYSGDISDQTSINGNISVPPEFGDPDNYNYRLNYTSECINAGDPNFNGEGLKDFEGNPRKMGQFVDIGAYEAWPVWNMTTGDKYMQIQEAINDANDGDRLIVTPGRYYENLNFNGKNVELRSVDPNQRRIVEKTIIDGNNADTVVLFESGEDANCVLAGFTITNGQASTDYGGGIRTRNNSGPTIRNNLIRDNTAKKGAGICMYHSSSMVLSNLIFGNTTAGIGQGAGMMIIDCLAEPNAIIANNIIVGNTAYYAGGIRVQNSTAHIANNIIAHNRARWEGIGVYAEGDTIENCIVWGNINIGTTGQGSAVYQCNAAYSCIDDEVPGQGNISEDPNFANPGYWDDANTPSNFDDDFFVLGNYHLSPNSPCIDAGDNNSIPVSLDVDIDGEERIFADKVDIGADELVTNPADFNTDGIVDFLDISTLVDEWLTGGSQLESDLYDDDFIDFADYAELARQWYWAGGWHE